MHVRVRSALVSNNVLSGGPWKGSEGDMTIAPVGASGSVVYWTTSNGTVLKGFKIGDETVQSVITPTQASTACVGCHTSTPDGLDAAFSASNNPDCGKPEAERPLVCWTNGEPPEAAQTAPKYMLPDSNWLSSKAKNIKACCQALVQKHAGQVPRTMEELTQLGGVGRKTANVVLGNAFGVNCGVVVDTHVARLSQRLGLTKQKAPEKIEQELMKLAPQGQWTMLSHWLIWHGRRRCYARNPGCAGCEIQALCPRLGVPKATAA